MDAQNIIQMLNILFDLFHSTTIIILIFHAHVKNAMRGRETWALFCTNGVIGDLFRVVKG